MKTNLTILLENLEECEQTLSYLRDEKDSNELSEAHRLISEALTLLGRE